MEAATPFKKLGGAHQNTRRHMSEELLAQPKPQPLKH
jgi:hypothetical protein